MKKAVLQLETLVCPSCSMKIEGALKSITGIDKESISVLFNASKVKLSFDETQVNVDAMKAAINKVGFEVLKMQVKE
ncbi:MAG: cation transporter [Erysipelotrichaceae bacterium]|nr:heavy-metal-associated domain-containing protein [Erysipelothrix sp.]MCD8519708.1 cation transporter [Erysipelotrichaceae bacterium]